VPISGRLRIEIFSNQPMGSSCEREMVDRRGEEVSRVVATGRSALRTLDQDGETA
jgi:hypothetical protein